MSASRPVPLLPLLLSLVACDGDGGSSAPGGSVPPADGPSAASGVNAPYDGTLFLGERRLGYALDLSSGEFERIPGVPWEDDLGGRDYPQAFSFEAAPRPFSGEEFVLTVDACQLDPAVPFLILDHCIALHDASGTELAARLFELETQVEGLPSPDGAHIATVMDNDLVVVLDRELEIVAQSRVPDAVVIRSLSWLSDDEFVFGSDDTIWRASVADPGGRRLVGFDEDDLDEVAGVAASPDGERLAFSYGDDLFVLELADLAVRRLPLVETFGFLNARRPAWSPDGGALAVKVHGTGLTWTGATGEITEPGGFSTFVFIDDATVIVPLEFGQPGPDGEPVLDAHLVSARTTMYKQDRSAAEAPLDTALDLDEEASMWWLP